MSKTQPDPDRQRATINDLARKIDRLEAQQNKLEEALTFQDETGHSWTPWKIMSEFGVTRRQAIAVGGMVMGGMGMGSALIRAVSDPAAASGSVSGTIFAENIGSIDRPVEEFYVNKEYQAASDQNPVFESVQAGNQIIQSEHIETKNPETSTVIFDQIGDFDKYIIVCDIRNTRDSSRLDIRFRDAGEDDSGDYTYFDNDGTENSGQDAIELATFFGGNSRLNGELIIYPSDRVGLTNNLHGARWDRHGSTTDYGGRDSVPIQDRIEFEFTRGSFQSGTELILIGVNYDI